MSYGKQGMNFTLILSNHIYNGFIPGYGEHNVYNALAAVAGAYVKGISIESSLGRLVIEKGVDSLILKGDIAKIII